MSQNILDLEGSFTWMWNDKFFIETEQGNFIWSDPQYDGDNTLTPTKLTYAEFLKQEGIDFGRCKGKRTIRQHCGDQVKLKQQAEEAANPQPELMRFGPTTVNPIEWSEPEPPNKESSYDHVFGKCGLGKFNIEWKSWKQYDSYSVTLRRGIGEEYIGEGVDLDEAKGMAYKFLCKKLSSCLTSTGV